MKANNVVHKLDTDAEKMDEDREESTGRDGDELRMKVSSYANTIANNRYRH